MTYKEKVEVLTEALREIILLNKLRFERYYPSRAEDVVDSMVYRAQEALEKIGEQA